MKILVSTFLICSYLTSSCQINPVHNDSIRSYYQKAFIELQSMLEGTISPDFKRAVFVTENAFLNNQANYDVYNSGIKFLAQRCKNVMSAATLNYDDRDKEIVLKNFSVFKLMTDTNKFFIDSIRHITTNPYIYDFEDFWGEKDWTKMFVLKLLQTNKGNCHSLPFLYKILCEELGSKAYLALAPNHIYIKQYAKSLGWYNTELTSGQFPIDAWIMASGYIHLNAIQNGVYMDTLSAKQSIAICLTDLAKGYEKKFSGDFDFVLKCTNLTLKHYPIYTNALLLQAETLKKQFEAKMKAAGVEYPTQMFQNIEAKNLFDEMEKSYFKIYQIGYRTMPKEMYMDWLVDLKNHKEKYQNRTMVNKLNPGGQ